MLNLIFDASSCRVTEEDLERIEAILDQTGTNLLTVSRDCFGGPYNVLARQEVANLVTYTERDHTARRKVGYVQIEQMTPTEATMRLQIHSKSILDLK